MKEKFQFIYDTVKSNMEKLDKKQINVEQAKAMASLAKQANNSLRYELERATLQLKINEATGIIDKNLKIREIELTNPEA